MYRGKVGSRLVVLDQKHKPAINRINRLWRRLGSRVKKTFKISIPRNAQLNFRPSGRFDEDIGLSLYCVTIYEKLEVKTISNIFEGLSDFELKNRRKFKMFVMDK
jgi:hypothetical protein